MTILEAYRAAIRYPIADLPKIYLQHSAMGRRFFLREDVVGGSICIVDEDALEGDYRVTFTLEELMSETWDVKIEKGNL